MPSALMLGLPLKGFSKRTHTLLNVSFAYIDFICQGLLCNVLGRPTLTLVDTLGVQFEAVANIS